MSVLDKIRHLFRPQPSCEDVNRFLVEYFEGSLAPDLNSRFQTHLALCPQCSTFADQYRMTINLVKENDPIAVPDPLVEHTLAFLRNHYKQH